MYMSKGMSSIGIGAHSIKVRGFNKAEVQFNNYKDANKAILSKDLTEQGIDTYIPRYQTEKKAFLNVAALISTPVTSPTTLPHRAASCTPKG